MEARFQGTPRSELLASSLLGPSQLRLSHLCGWCCPTLALLHRGGPSCSIARPDSAPVVDGLGEPRRIVGQECVAMLWQAIGYVTITELIGNFRVGLLAVLPSVERLGIPSRRPDAYDHWDALATAVYTALVIEPLLYASSTLLARRKHPLMWSSTEL